MPRQRSHRGHGEGTIVERKDGRYQVAITLETGKRKFYYAKSRKEALDILRKAQHEMQQGTLVTSPKQTVQQFLTQWLEDYKPTVRIRTYERVEQYVRIHIVPEIGHVALQKLTPAHIKSLYSKKLKEGLSPTTVAHLHNVFHKALEDAVRLELLMKNVTEAVKPPRKARYEIKPLTVEQAKKLLDAARGQSLEALWIVALTTGMRRGEILALKWQDVDLLISAKGSQVR